MARIGIGKGKSKTKTVNAAGGEAFIVEDPAVALVHVVGQFFNEPQYYTDNGEAEELQPEAKNVIDLAQKLAAAGRHEELLCIARWARTDMNFRTTPIILLAAACQDPSKTQVAGKGLVRAYAATIMQRADEPRNLFAAWRHIYGGVKNNLRTTRVPSTLRRSVADAYRGMSEYSLAKWAGNEKPSLSDTVRVCDRGLVKLAKILYFVNHDAWQKRREETPLLDARDKVFASKTFDEKTQELAKKAGLTWENLVSHFKSSDEVWEFAVKQMGYMALLRNLRNLEQHKVDLDDVVKRLTDEDEVKKARQMPFRYLSAIENVESPKLKKALSKAMDLSLANVPELKGKTAVCVDVSGSMDQAVSGKSTRSCADAAAALAGVFYTKGDSYIIAFADQARIVNVHGSGAMAATEAIRSVRDVGGGTNPTACIPKIPKDVARVILLSDMQCYSDRYGYSSSFNSAWKQWRTEQKSEAWVHSINLAGTVEAQLDRDIPKVNLMSGFSESLLALIAATEANENPKEAVSVSVAEIVKKFKLS